MTEEQARAWLVDELGVSRETLEQLQLLIHLLAKENERQNLVSASSFPVIWNRHVVDSAQLLRHVPEPARCWIDLGTGAGFPGLIIALLSRARIVLVEERRKRAEFLQTAVELLGCSERVQVIARRVETVDAEPFDVISARAFAPLDRLLALGQRFAAPTTRWVLPKGRNAKRELEAAMASWQGDFHLVPSLTDDDAWIIVAERVSRRAKGKQVR